MKKVLNISIDEDLVAKLKQLAESENRTVSNLVETLLLAAINDNSKSV